MRTGLYQIVFVLVIAFRIHQAQDSSVEKFLYEESEKLDKVAGFQTPLVITDEGLIKADHDKGILINRKLLEEYKRKSNVTNFQSAIRLILAHEKAHFIQYDSLSYGKMENYPPEMRQVMECQADILAGKYMVESITNELIERIKIEKSEKIPWENISEYNADIKTLSEEALQLFYDIGESEYAMTDHPYKEQRRLAIKIGRLAGMLYYLQIAVQKYGIEFSTEDWKRYNEMYFHLSYLNEVFPNDDVFGWSLRQAKRIMHYNPMAARNLIIERNMGKTHWDTSQAHPVVSYSFNMINNGKEAIKAYFEVRTEGVLREDENNTKSSDRLWVKNYRVTLQPGESYPIEDSLIWGYANKQFMPQIIFPDDPLALISVEFADENYKPEYIPGVLLPPKDTLNIPQVVKKIRAKADSKFMDCILGSGARYIWKDGYHNTLYRCISPFSNAYVFIPKDNNKSPYVSIEIYNGRSEKNANSSYQKVVSELKRFYSMDISENMAAIEEDNDIDTSTDFKETLFSFTKDKTQVEIRWDKNQHDFSVDLKISSIKEQ